MLSTRRKFVLVAGAAALLSTQAAQAAPPSTAPTTDPLVALSLLGSAQSRAALCRGSATCGLPAAPSVSAASASPALAASAAAAQGGEPSPGRRGMGLLLAITGMMILIAVGVALLFDPDSGDQPISPA